MNLRLVSLVLLGCLWGCSSSDKPAPAPDPLATSDGFCHEWAVAACNDNVVTACSGTTTASDTLRTACQVQQTSFCMQLLPSGSYGEAHAQACLDAVRTAYADGKLTASDAATVRDLAAPCNQLVKGPVADGGTCTTDFDCDTLSGSVCIKKNGAGTCGLPNKVANGTSCKAANATCNDGFYCDGSNCVAQKSAGDTCANDDECSAGLACTAQACAPKTSATMCTQDSDCANQACEIATGGSTGTCRDQIILSPTESICEDLK